VVTYHIRVVLIERLNHILRCILSSDYILCST